jgi:arabinogalactan endo-1,4-beta-galactosidase
MAQRVKQAGFGLLLDFHYSDWWADPATQTKPAAWKNLSYNSLVTAVYNYTANVLNALKAVNAYPDMVQIGNEISGGLLWDDGRIENGPGLAGLLNSGIKAVRDTTPSGKYTKIMIHVAEGGDKERFQYFFDLIEANGVTDYNVIGMSYYAFWHGTLQAAKNNMNNIVARYGKEVVIVETSFPYTNADADNYPNMIAEEDLKISGMAASVKNQKIMTEMTMNTVATVNNEKGLGVFYWEPLWIPVRGAGVAKGEGNEWDNQILFDANTKKEMDSLNAFQYNPQSAQANNAKHVIVYSPAPIKVQVDAHASLTEVLPKTVDVLRFDGTIVKLNVAWTGANNVDMGKVATYTFNGVVSGLNLLSGVDTPAPKITVHMQRNLVKNPGFEIVSGTVEWNIVKITGNAGQITNGPDSTPKNGIGSFHYWDNKNFCVELSQEITVTPNHSYKLSAWAQGSWANINYNDSYIFARYTDSSGRTYTLGKKDILNANYGWWNEFTLDDIQVPAGTYKITVGARISGYDSGYGTFDDFELTDNNPTAAAPSGANYVINGDFEALDNSGYPSMVGWEVNPKNNSWPQKAWAEASQNRTAGGTYAFNYYNPSSFELDLNQTVSNLDNGSYKLTFYSYGSNDNKSVSVYATSGSNTKQIKVTDTNQWNSATNSPAWELITLDNISISINTMTIRINIVGVSGSWGYFDDFKLEKK